MKRIYVEEEESLKDLREMIKPGDKIWTLLRHVSASGMMRHIAVIKLEANVIGDIRPYYLNYQVARVLGHDIANDMSLKVSGCGMDMGFHVVYSLGRVLFPEGFDCIGDNCPANDHVNGDDNKHHEDGGYALRQEWL